METVKTIDAVEVASRLRPVLVRLGRELRQELHALGVTGAQVTLLAAIRKAPGIGVRELALRERVSTPGTSKTVARLESAGLVTRTAGADRRRVGLAVTDAGDRVLRSVKSRRTAWLAARLRGLGDDELEAVDRAIEPLARLLELEP